MHDVGRKVIVGENVARRKATQIDHGENDHHAPQPNVFLNFAVPRKPRFNGLLCAARSTTFKPQRPRRLHTNVPFVRMT